MVHLSLQQQFTKLYSFWSVWGLDLCSQSEQLHLPCYCSHNELWTYLYFYLSYQELMYHYLLNEPPSPCRGISLHCCKLFFSTCNSLCTLKIFSTQSNFQQLRTMGNLHFSLMLIHICKYTGTYLCSSWSSFTYFLCWNVWNRSCVK